MHREERKAMIPPQRHLDREIFSVKVDQFRAALIHLRMTESDLDISSSNEHELRISIAQ